MEVPVWQGRDVKQGKGKGDRVKSKGSRRFLPWAEGALGVSPSGALCTAEMSELEIISLYLYSFSFNRCCYRGRAGMEISRTKGDKPSQVLSDPPLRVDGGSHETKKLIGKKCVDKLPAAESSAGSSSDGSNGLTRS